MMKQLKAAAEFVVHCVLCGKNFRADNKYECGGLMNGKPMCKTDDIKLKMDNRQRVK